MSMNVNWRYIHAVPMPTALTQMAASTVHVGKALKAMDSTVQVDNYTNTVYCYGYFFNTLLQTFQSVKEVWTVVIQMQLVQIQSGVTTVCATLALLEMDLHVQVSKQKCFKICTAVEAVKIVFCITT